MNESAGFRSNPFIVHTSYFIVHRLLMTAINLIPAPRLDARRRRSRRNRCVLGCAAYAVAAVAASGAAHGRWGEAGAHVADELTAAAADVDQTGKAIAGVRADLDAAHAT